MSAVFINFNVVFLEMLFQEEQRMNRARSHELQSNLRIQTMKHFQIKYNNEMNKEAIYWVVLSV